MVTRPSRTASGTPSPRLNNPPSFSFPFPPLPGGRGGFLSSRHFLRKCRAAALSFSQWNRGLRSLRPLCGHLPLHKGGFGWSARHAGWGCRGHSLASGGQKCFWAPAIFLWYRQAAPSRAAKPPRPIWAAPQVRRRRREPVCQATGVYQIKGAPAALCAVGKKKETVGPKALPFGEEKMRPFGRKEKPGPLCAEKRGSRPFGRRIKKAPGGALFDAFSLLYSRAVRYSALYTATEGSLSSRISKNRRKVILLSPATRQRVSSGKKGSRIARAKSLSKRL